MSVLGLTRITQIEQIAAVGLRAHGVDLSPRAYQPKGRPDLGCALVARLKGSPRWGVIAVEEERGDGSAGRLAGARAASLARCFAAEYHTPPGAVRADTAVVELTGPATARVNHRTDIRFDSRIEDA